MPFFTPKKIVITHNGNFHPDDVFAVATLSILNRGAIKVIRTRDGKKISKADYVVDVGGIYDAENDRFDHHQVGGAGNRENGVPYASFGLVWKKFGEKICGGEDATELIDRELIQYIDATDNGVGEEKPIFNEVMAFTVNNMIMNMNSVGNPQPEDFDEKFYEAIKMAISILHDFINQAREKILARKYIKEVYQETTDKRIVILEKSVYWFDTVKNFPETMFVVEPEYEADSKKIHWKVKCVRDNPNNFINRKDLPVEWAGKRDREFADVSGVSDAVFCHTQTFYGCGEVKRRGDKAS